MGAFGWSKKGGHACNRASLSGNGIMGACFQAPCAAPRQRLMETYIGECVWAIRILL